jgi:signal transduction histidine kinase
MKAESGDLTEFEYQVESQDSLTPTGIPELLTSVVQWAAELMRADGGLIQLWDPERAVLVQAISCGICKAYDGATLKPGEGLGGKILQSGEPMIVRDYGSWEGRSASYEPIMPFAGSLAVPLKWQDQVVGVLTIDADSRRRAFGQDDIRDATLFADLASLAIKNAQLYEALEDRSQELQRILEQEVAQRTQELAHRALQMETSAKVSREITAILDIDRLLSRVVQLIYQAFGHYSVQIFLVDADTDHLVLRAAIGQAGRRLRADGLSLAIDGTSLNSTAVRTNAALLVNDVSQEPRFWTTESLPDTRSELVIPLRVGQQAIGTLDVQMDRTDAFREDDLLVYQSLGDQIAIAIENARLYDRSRELAILEERTRLARELHDSVTQSLFSVHCQAGAVATYLDRDLARSKRELDELRRTAHDALQGMRELIFDLRPVSLKAAGLAAALRDQVEQQRTTGGPELLFEESGNCSLPLRVEEHLLHIAQEALRNAIKHARAQRIMVSLIVEPDWVDLCVADDGQGFDPQSLAAEERRSFGLIGLRERAKLLKGSLDVLSKPGEGTKVRVRVPILDEAEDLRPPAAS